MKKVFIFFVLALFSWYGFGQNCNAPNQVTAVANSHNDVSISWNLNGRTRNVASIELWNQADLITHPSSGYNGAPISALYGDGNSYGFTCTAPSWYLADDFTISERSVITQMDFYVYQTNGVIDSSSISGVYLAIFDQQPTDETLPIWGGDDVNRLNSSYWSGIYRTTSSVLTYTDTARPIMRVVADVNLDLTAGEYWVAVCFEGNSALGGVFAVPRTVISELSTGNAMQYNPNDEANRWTALQMGQNMEQQGLPFTVRGFYVSDSLASFNVYRNGILLNSEPVGTYSYTDHTTSESGDYCYSVEALYLNGCVSGMSDEACVFTPENSCLIRTIPYTENFDQYNYGTGTFLPCWQRHPFGTSTTLPYLYSSSGYYVSAPGALHMGAANQMVLMPEISPDINISDLEVVLSMRKSSASYSLDVGVVGDFTNNISDFTLVQNVTTSAITIWEELVISLENYTATDGKRIAFKAAGGIVYIDNVTLRFRSPCPEPDSMAISSSTTSDVTLTWVPGGSETTWNLEYKLDNSDTWVQINNLASPTYTITGLSASRRYTIETRVQAICSDEGSNWEETTLTHTTDCHAINTFPYFLNFDNYAAVTYNASGGEAPVCWNTFSNNSTYHPPHVRTGASYAYRTSEPNSLGFTNGTSGSGPKGTAILPEFQVALNGLYISFWCRMESLTYGVLSIGYLTEFNNDTTFVSLISVPNNTTGVWHEYFLNSYTFPTGARLALQWMVTNGTFYSCCIDDLTIDLIPTCVPPANITATITQPESATITWTPSVGETQWDFSYKHQDSTAWIYDYGLTTPSTTIFSLLTGEFYEVRVKAVCSDVDQSRWSDVYTFLSTCHPISTLPVTYNFDNHSTGTTAFDWCWNKITSTATSVNHNATHFSSPGSLYIYSSSTNTSYAVMPRIADNISMSSLQLEFKLRKSSAAYNLTVGVLENPDSASTFVPVATVSPSAASIWEIFDVKFDTYTGTGKYIAFRSGPGGTANTVYVDDLKLNYISDCQRVSSVDIVVSSTEDGNQAEVTWTEEDDVTYSIFYQSSGDTEWTVLDNVTSPHTLADLTNNMTYYLKIITHCDDDDLESNTQTFSIPCGEIEELPYRESFDSYGTGTGTFPTCWSRYYSGTVTNYPYINSTNSSSPGSLYMYVSTAAYYVMAISPRISPELNLNNLEFSFKLRKNTATHSIDVGMISDPALGDSTFIYLTTLTPDATSDWQTFTIKLDDYTDTARRIAFRSERVGTNTTNLIYVDDFVLDYIPSCFIPDSIVVSNISTTEATISWDNPENVDSWNFRYRISGDGSWTTIVNHPEDSIVLDQLTANSVYEFQVQAECVEGFSSNWSEMETFATLCNPVVNLPYYESFDTYGTGAGTYPSCWRKYQYNNLGNLYITTTNSSAPGSLYIYTTSTTYHIVSTPEFSTPLNELQLSLKMRATGTAYELEVGFMDSPNDFESYEYFTSLYVSATSVWEDKLIYLDTYEGEKKCIAFKVDGLTPAATRTIYIDNIVVDLLPDCVPPVEPFADPIGSSSAFLDWSGRTDNVNSWNLLIGKVGDDLDTIAPIVITEKPYYIENLDFETEYQFKIMSECDNGSNSAYSTVATFKTLCGPVTEYPYYEYFDTYSVGSTSYPDCWITNTNHTAKAYVNTTHVTPPGGLYMYTTANTYKMFISPEMDVPVNELQVEFTMKTSSVYDIYIGAMSNPFDTSTFELIQTISPRTTYWNQYTVALTNYTGTGKHIVIKTGATVAQTIYFDNIKIDYAPFCVAPTGLTVSNIDHTTVTLIWPEIAGATYSVVYGDPGFNPNVDYPAIPVTENWYDVSGLDHSTDYEYYVKAHCSDGTSSNWSIACAFKTKCMDITVPYREDFDSWGYGTAGYPIPNCWTKACSNNANYPYISSTYKTSGVASLYLYASSVTSNYCAIVLPKLEDAIHIQDLTLSFMGYSASATAGFIVGVLTNPDDFSTFREVGRQVTGVISTWGSFEFDLASYSDTGKYIAIQVLTTSAVYVDDLILENTPTCRRFGELSADQITSNSADISWRDTVNNNPYAYEIEYGPSGFTLGTGTSVTTNNNPHTLLGLNEATYYDFYVRAICSISDTGVWSREVGTFLTSCSSVQPTPYVENFDSYTIPTTTYSAEGILPPCWIGLCSGSPAPHIINSGLYYYVQSSPNTLSLTARSSEPYAYAILPKLDTAVQLSKITFYYRYESASNGKLTVGYLTGSQSDISSFTEVREMPAHTGSMTLDSVVMTDYVIPADATYIAFRWHQSSSTARYSSCIDNLSIVGLDPAILLPDSCYMPVDLTVDSVTIDEAFISWDAGGENEISWIVEYKESSQTNYITVLCTTTNVVLANLLSETDYDVRVKAICGDDLESDYATTTCTTLTDDAPTYTITPSSGTNGSISPNYPVTVTEGGSAQFTINPNFNYVIKRILVDGDSVTIENPYLFSDVRQNHTIHVDFEKESGIADYGNLIKIYPNPAKEYVIIELVNLFEQIEIINSLGQIVYKKTITGSIINVDVHNYAAGIYVIKITNKEGVFMKKFVKE